MNDIQRFENLKKTIENDPANFQARRELAVLCLDLGFDQAAMKHLSYLINIFPDDANLYFNAGICWEKLKHPKYALNAYKKAVELKGDDPDFLYNLALAYEANGMDDEAMLNFKKVICINSDDSNAFFSIGVLYSKKNDPQNAIKCFKKAIANNYSDYFAHFYLAQEYKKINETENALEEYSKVIELSPDYSWAYYNIAQIYWERKNIQNAILMLRKAIEKNKKDIDACKLLINIYISTNDQKQALRFIAAVLKQFGAQGDIYYLAAKAYEKTQNFELYEKNLEQALNHAQTLTYNHLLVQKELLQYRKKTKNAVGNI